ncbi:hypothetical protein KY290_025164 [Solanum tuberosum]|uniref:Retrovirus-related Pol polyprotein from transposon TNT 1-94-like beta-barrel domain-containing protein n=1 Tax=Solanum tuberosum TaxID=4113 RepID=A0ABQ7USZ8_SOLTU|nr:hypothetical protein KY284_023966 [Solanum tuberosum]KAH0754894.1 hypothetical protein KY290_025164 [Solanum tuberosum]
MASVDATIASIVASAENSKAAWDHLHTSFAKKSQTRIFSLRHHLSRVSKDNKSIVDYLCEIRSLYDELATAGSPVNNEELVVKILSGLGPEFREILAAIRNAILPSATLNYSTNFLITKFSSSMRTKKRLPLRSQSHNHFDAKANIVAQTPTHDPWIVDLGASNHITSDANSLHNVQDFKMMEDVTMGNGNVIPITQTGTTHLSPSNNDFKLSIVLCAPAIKGSDYGNSSYVRPE